MVVCPVLSYEEVALLRLLAQAQAQRCRVIQDMTTRHIVLLPESGGSVSFARLEAARSWLRGYAECGRGARRCFAAGRHVCSVHR